MKVFPRVFSSVRRYSFASISNTSSANCHDTYKRPFTTVPRLHTNLSKYDMSSSSASHDLAQKLGSLDLADSLQSYPNCYPDVNPVDIYRAHLTSILTTVTGVDATIIYPALAWTNTLEKGDLVLPVPALRVKGKKPAELAAEWADKVTRRQTLAVTLLTFRNQVP